jgi:hypothetical protein
MAKITGLPVAFIAAGGVLVWSGVENEPVTSVFRSLAQGKAPAKGSAEPFATSATTAPAAPSTSGMPSGSVLANQAIARVLAAPYGWAAGQNWDDLVSLWNRESTWSATAKNADSGAYGIPQALPPTKMPAAAQESGGSSASAQISWGLSYIKATYGSPSAAWAHEQAEGWY